MSALETLGLFWLVATSTLAHMAIVWAAYRHLKRTKDNADTWESQNERLVLRGHQAEQADLTLTAQVRETINNPQDMTR